MAYIIKVDKDACIGCGACEAVTTDEKGKSLFVMKNGKAKPLKSKITDKELKAYKEGEESCPVEAITIKKA
ncbi:MAG: ferredoxin [Nanoarchaeota archaeon]|nr:ferredoxin [Nanoarchaeota archaeon]